LEAAVFNWAQKDALADLIPLAKKHDVGLMAIRPLQGGAFVDQVRNALRFVLCSPVDVAVTGGWPANVSGAFEDDGLVAAALAITARVGAVCGSGV